MKRFDLPTPKRKKIDKGRFRQGLPALLFTILVAVFFIELMKGNIPGLSRSVHTLETVPPFSVPLYNNDDVVFSEQDLNGKITVVNFFASWCAPCRIEHPLLMKIAQGDDNIQMVGIAYKDADAAITQFLDTMGNPYDTIAMDREGAAAIPFGISGVPETFVINKMGHIQYRTKGPVMPDDVDDVIIPMLKRLTREGAE